jgi:anaerobic carbon-monoxide dehydrogenase catalytic subunit
METIHLKTVDPISQDLLRAAGQKGIQLNWERYEKLQPQDGFLRLGLSCPYGCLQGPCRIDPFGRGSDRGLCGLDRQGMAAAALLRLTIQGALEIADGRQSDNPGTGSRMTAAPLEKLGGSPISIREVYQSAAMLSRPGASFEEIVHQAVRMGLFAVDRLSEGSGSDENLSCRAGYGILAENPITVAVCGNVACETIESLVETAAQQTGVNFQVLSLGDWIPLKDRYLPLVCSGGEAELVLSTGKIGYLLAGSGTDPGILDACRRLEIPICQTGTPGDTPDPQQILEAAQAYHSRHQKAAFSPDPSSVDDGRMTGSVDALKAVFERAGDRKVAVIGGSDMPHQPHGLIPVEVAKALRGRNVQIAAWGDAATWMIKGGLCSDARENPVIVLEPETGVFQIVAALQQLGRPEQLAGICFSGLKGCRDLSAALGLAAIGARVNVAVPIPLWGSEPVRTLLTETLSDCGGELTHYDHPAQPEEILDWFDK